MLISLKRRVLKFIMHEADEKARLILLEWAKLKGHDRCWWYPEFIQPLAEIYDLSLGGIVLTPESRDLFEEGCARFIREQYRFPRSEPDTDLRDAKSCLVSWITAQREAPFTYHDSILQQLAKILKVEIPRQPNVLEGELQEGCRLFQLEKYPK